MQRSALTLLFVFLADCADLRQTPAALVQNGITFEAKGNTAGALILFRKAIQLDARYGPAEKAIALAAPNRISN